MNAKEWNDNVLKVNFSKGLERAEQVLGLWKK
jgi:hypothetical protein